MKKMNKKGFVLAETITISIVVITALVIIYTQFINIDNSYYRSFNYNNVNDLYLVGQVKDFINTNGYNINNYDYDTNDFLELTDCSTTYIKEYIYCENLFDAIDAKRVIITKNNTEQLSKNINNYNFSDSLKRFIKNSKSQEDGIKVIVEFNDNTVASLKLAGSSQLGLGPKCKRATTLHTEACEYTSGISNCYSDGYSTGSAITYGNENTTDSILVGGDAFDCDVNGDGTYDAATERFYYVSDLYDTTTKTFNSNYAVLIYYNNTTKGVSDSTSVSEIEYYAPANENWHGPVTAKTNLPTITQWNNVSLSNSTRSILTNSSATSTTGGTLPTNFSYGGYAARLLTYQELIVFCDETFASSVNLETCKYLLENTKYSSDSKGTIGYWLETPQDSTPYFIWYVEGAATSLSGSGSNVTYGVRPVIEVLKTDMDY